MKKRPWLKWVGIALCAVMIVCIVIAFHRVKLENDAERAELRKLAQEYEEVMRPLWNEKARLEREIAEQEKAVAAEAPPSPVILLCTEPKDEVLSDVLPITEQYLYPVALVLSEDAFPGEADRLDVSDVLELCDLGWELCLGADADTDLSALCSRVTDAGLPLPTAVYYPSDEPTTEQEQAALSLGIQTVIQYGKNTPESGTEGLWYVSAYGSNESDSKTSFQAKLRSAVPQALTVGFTDSREQFSETNYSNMLKTIRSYEKSDDAVVMGIREANEAYFRNRDDAFSQPESEAERQLRKLQEELEAVNSQIWDREKRS